MAVFYDLTQLLTEPSFSLADGNPNFGPTCDFPPPSQGLVQDILQCRDVTRGGHPLVLNQRKDAQTPHLPLVPSAQLESLTSLDVYLK